mmetsp:Transcript_13151/g.22262  ORF Transcript_13151/g.22262 Transcript_13151/m.22262 type:complete len:155 (-) Transcript_13151:37-501(-)
MAEKVPRFDKILLSVKQQGRSNSQQTMQPRGANTTLHELLHKLVEGKKDMQRIFPEMLNTKEFKQQFLRGQPFNITAYVEPRDPKITSYQATMQGKHHKDKAKILDFERLSCGVGGVIPDPLVLSKNQSRLRKFSNDLTNMTQQQFGYSGEQWN